MNGEQKTFAIEVYVPIRYDKFDDTNYKTKLSEELYPLVKGVNTNNKVDTVTIVIHTRKYIGSFPISKSQSASKKIIEI